MEHATDADYSHAKRVCKDFENEENIMIFMFKEMPYYYQTYLITFEIFVLKYKMFILKNFFQLLD